MIVEIVLLLIVGHSCDVNNKNILFVKYLIKKSLTI